jgi:hypothetical protein
MTAIGKARVSNSSACNWWRSSNQQTICLPSEPTENHRQHNFPIGSLTSTLLATQRSLPQVGRLSISSEGTRKLSPFNRWSKSKAALDKLANIPH